MNVYTLSADILTVFSCSGIWHVMGLYSVWLCLWHLHHLKNFAWCFWNWSILRFLGIAFLPEKFYDPFVFFVVSAKQLCPGCLVCWVEFLIHLYFIAMHLLRSLSFILMIVFFFISCSCSDNSGIYTYTHNGI